MPRKDTRKGARRGAGDKRAPELITIQRPKGRRSVRGLWATYAPDNTLREYGIVEDDLVVLSFTVSLRDGALGAVEELASGDVFLGVVRLAEAGSISIEGGDAGKTLVAGAWKWCGEVVQVERDGKIVPHTTSDAVQQHIEALRPRLDGLYEAHDESARFKILREIYDLEQGAEAGEWPKYIYPFGKGGDD